MEPRNDSVLLDLLLKVLSWPVVVVLEVWWWFWYCSEELGPAVKGDVEKKVMHMKIAIKTLFVIAGGVNGSGDEGEDSYSSEASCWLLPPNLALFLLATFLCWSCCFCISRSMTSCCCSSFSRCCFWIWYLCKISAPPGSWLKMFCSAWFSRRISSPVFLRWLMYSVALRRIVALFSLVATATPSRNSSPSSSSSSSSLRRLVPEAVLFTLAYSRAGTAFLSSAIRSLMLLR